MHEIVIRLQALRGHVNPMDCSSIQPSTWCTTVPYQSNKKERDHTCKACPLPDHVMTCKNGEARHSGQLFQHNDRQGEKRKMATCFTLLKRIATLTKPAWKNREASHSGQLFQHNDRQGENRKIANWFTLLKRITRLKIVNSEIRPKDQNSYLERYSPKGSCHRDESSMSHTLAQNCRCEFGCGVHLTCKNTNN